MVNSLKEKKKRKKLMKMEHITDQIIKENVLDTF